MSSALPGYHQANSVAFEAADRLRAQAPPAEFVGLESAMGRVLASPLRADRDQPPFARSTRDGFACRAAEASNGTDLSIAGSTRAGDAPGGPLPKQSVWEIMTGAPLPMGADAVAMLEHVDSDNGHMKLHPLRRLQVGENVVARGAQARQGDLLLPAGSRIAAAQIAVAAECGYASIETFVRPLVAILTTGDELVPVDAFPAPGQIRNSNAPMLAALVAAQGGKPWILPTIADSAGALDAAIAEASAADLLIFSGGVSAGKFDLVEPALARAGARFHFTGVRIQPGKPLVFGELPAASVAGDPGQRRSRCFFGLPGNPVSSYVTFLLFAAPILAALAGCRELPPRFGAARIGSGLKGKPGLTRFLPAFFKFESGQSLLPEVELVPWQGSGDLAALARSNCFLVIPEDTDKLEAGAVVQVLLA